jgi:hypothetical protein
VELREIARSKIPIGSRLRCLPDSVNFEHLLDEMSSDELTIRSVEVFDSNGGRIFDFMVEGPNRRLKVLVEEASGRCERYQLRQIVD